MTESRFLHVGRVRDAETFRRHLREVGVELPCDDEVVYGAASPLAAPLSFGGATIGNRFTVQPMEGWDGTAEGRPTELTFRRWRNFGASGAKLVWGGRGGRGQPRRAGQPPAAPRGPRRA